MRSNLLQPSPVVSLYPTRVMWLRSGISDSGLRYMLPLLRGRKTHLSVSGTSREIYLRNTSEAVVNRS